jgi:hypothetical protein
MLYCLPEHHAKVNDVPLLPTAVSLRKPRRACHYCEEEEQG